MLAPLCAPEILDFEPIRVAVEIARLHESRALLLDLLEKDQSETRRIVMGAVRAIQALGHDGS